MSEILTAAEAVELARSHVNNDRLFRHSATSKLISAQECAEVGQDIDALFWSASSLSYSVGFQHDDYKRVRAAHEATREKYWSKS